MYKNPKSTVDTVIEKNGKILLVTRGIEPQKCKLALPGGHVNFGENVEFAAVREVEEETGLKVKIRCILGVYSDPKREPLYPQCHTISIAFIAEIIGGQLKAGDDAQKADFFEIKDLKKGDFAFDHWKIIHDYLKWKYCKGTYWSSK